MESPSPLVSIIIPVKDEGENILELAAEILAALEPAGWTWECVWVDDGSQDNTLPQLRHLHAREPRHTYVSFDRNYGQTAAMLAGFRRARGQVLATLDGDGQNDPADLPAMLQSVLTNQADLVNGVRVRRQDTWMRKVSSRIGNGFRNWLTHEQVTDVGCSLRAFRRECVATFPPFEGLHRFFPTLVRMRGWRLIEVPVGHRPRRRGTTKYGIRNRLWKGLFDALAVRWMQWRQIRYRITEQAETTREGDMPWTR
jgi:glycosyltransferase involved in cell wall biosynthesis